MPKFTNLTAPAAWASYLVNGDSSGMAIGEVANADAWLRDNEVQHVADVARGDDGEAQEARFTWQFRLYDPLASVRGGEVLDYVCEVKP